MTPHSRFLLSIYVLSGFATQGNAENDTAVADHDRSDYWPVIAIMVIQACVSVAAFKEITAAPAPVPQRLPRSILPLHYSIHIIPKNIFFSGHVQILVHVVEPTDNITLHARHLYLDEETVSIIDESSNHNMIVKVIEYEPQNEWYVIKLEKSLCQGNNYILNIAYNGQTNDRDGGIKWNNYISGDENRLIILTLFEPTGARSAFPCFDEPYFKAYFNVSVATPPGMHALSNMPLLDASEPVVEFPGWFWSHFEQSKSMSTYLVAFVLSDFVEVRSPQSNKFSVWAQPELVNKTSLLTMLGPTVVEVFEEFTGIPYMLPKLDNVVIPSFDFLSFSGTECWGLTMYIDQFVLYDEEEDTITSKQHVIHLLLHEVAHNWFGNLVSQPSWDDLWLKEGFSSYFAIILGSKIFPDWKIEEDFVITTMQDIFTRELPNLNKIVNSKSDIENKYSIFTYEKGASVIRMMEHILSMTIFQAGVRQYLRKNSYQITTARDLYEAMDLAVMDNTQHSLPPGVGIEQIMDPWVSQAGFPLISVERNYDSGLVSVCQKEFPGLKESNKSSTWWVPLSYTVQEEADFNSTTPKFWLPYNQTCVTLPETLDQNKWIIFNIRQTGFYRVNYDIQNWKLLADFLNSDQFSTIHVLNRAQLLDDALDLVNRNVLPLEMIKSLTSYLPRETSPFPWLVALRSDTFNSKLEKAHVLSLGLKFLELVQGFPLDLPSKEPQIWLSAFRESCTGNPTLCTDSSYNLLAAFKTDPVNNRILPDLSPLVYCNGLKSERATEEDIQFLWQQIRRIKSKKQRYLLIRILSKCPKHQQLQQRVLVNLGIEDMKLGERNLKNVLYSTCTNNQSWRGIVDILGIIQDRQGPALNLQVLQTVTATIGSNSNEDSILDKVWCLIIMSWLKGVSVF